MADLRAAFHREMIAHADVFRRVLGYAPTRTLQMVGEHGALDAAHRLIQMPATSGLTDLYLAGRLDLSVEWLVLQDSFRSFFTADELRQADKTLRDHGFTFPSDYRAP